ncbi:MAG: RluA family pseudouridine synthase [Bdellovibrionota bacterium]
MSLKKITFKTTKAHSQMRLDQVLSEELPAKLGQPVSKSSIRKLIVAGAVYVEKKRTRIASRIIPPQRMINIWIDEHKLFSSGRWLFRPFDMTQEHILYEDEYIIAIDKPPHLPTQPTLDEARDNLFAALKRFITTRDNIVEPYLGLHHRLDRDTSGVIIFAKRREANAGLSRIFSQHEAVKVYNALTIKPKHDTGTLPSAWSVKNYIKRSNTSGKRGHFVSTNSGGDYAHTDFQILEILADGLLIEALPKTGRTHQIRVHLAEAGIPILGDENYGGSAMLKIGQNKIARLMLHAMSLTFCHPVNKTELTIRSPLPRDFLQCLQALRK